MFLSILAVVRRAEAAIAAALMAILVAVVFLGAVARYLGAPQVWSEELAAALFAWLAMLGADLTLQRAGHFRIDLLTARLPAGAQAALDVALKLVVAAMLAILVYYGVDFLEIAHPQPLPMLGVPSSLAAAALPVAFGLMFITTVEQILRRLRGEQDVAAARDVM